MSKRTKINKTGEGGIPACGLPYEPTEDIEVETWEGGTPICSSAAKIVHPFTTILPMIKS